MGLGGGVMRARGILQLSLISLCFAWTLAARSQTGGEVAGSVRLASGQLPPQGTVLSIHSDAGEIVQQTTPQGSGYFQFSGLRRMVYYVTAKAPGYHATTERADIFSQRRVSVYLTLVPEKRDEPTGPGGVVSQGQLLVPEGAQKEFDKGRKLVESKEPEKSLSHFRRAIEIYPSYALVYMYLGLAQMSLQKMPEAQVSLGKAVELNDKLAAALLGLGACLNLQGNYAAAEKPLVRGLELDPETADGQFELSKTFWALGRWQDAEPHVRKVIALRPEFPVAHHLLGNILMRKRDAPAALQEFREYLRLEPNGPFAPPTCEFVAKIEQALTTPH